MRMKKRNRKLNYFVTKKIFLFFEGGNMNSQAILFALLLSTITNATDTNLNTNTNFLLLLLLALGNNNSCGCGCNQNTCPNNFTTTTFI